MSRFRVEFVPSAARDYRRLPSGLRSRAAKAFEAIACDPLGGKPLQGPYAGLRSRRFGEYRIVYRVDGRAGVALVYRLGHRRDVYR